MPAVAAAQARERVVEIRVHGNHTTPGAEILALSGLRVGTDAGEAALLDAKRRLETSRRFSGVDVLRRYASIADASQILIILVVDELPGIAVDDLTPGPMRRVRAAGMWLPIVSYADGYGFTYGARIAFIEPLGARTRVAVPLTWGGERRVGVELQRTFERGPVHSLLVSGALYRRVNPHFDLRDRRLELRVRGERAIARWLRAGAGLRTAQVEFGDGVGEGESDGRDRHDAFGANVTVDTRVDPSFPRNAIYVSTGIERLHARALPRAAVIKNADLRGYAGIGGSMVAALRAEFRTSNRGLPPVEQLLLGGADTLRGYTAGFRAGDNVAAISAEVRVPVHSPLSTGRFGIKAFIDAGTTWNVGERLRGRRFDRGVGGGIYFGGGPVIGDLAIAWPERGRPRVHFGLGVTF